MSKTSRPWLPLAVSSGVIIIMGLLVSLGATKSLELKIQDLSTRLIASPQELPTLVLLDVDDGAMQNVGTWPWSRDLHASYLGELRSLGADTVTFDVEFVDRGPVGVNSQERDGVLSGKSQELDQVFQALDNQQMEIEEVHEAAKILLNEGILLTARDNDAFLGQAMKSFGNVFTTLNYYLENANEEAKQAEAYLKSHNALSPLSGDIEGIIEVASLRGAIIPIASQATGAGVTNVVKDVDGTLRRIGLLYRLAPDGSGQTLVFGQLAFTPIWVHLGRPSIEVTAGQILLKTSELKTNPQPDITIPLDPEGKMLINWPHETYDKTFRHVKISQLQDMQKQWLSLLDQIKAMQDSGYFQEDLSSMVTELSGNRQLALAAGDQRGFDEADRALSQWRLKIVGVLQGTQEVELKAALEAQALDLTIPEASRAKIPALLLEVGDTYDALEKKWTAYYATRASLAEILKGALCFYGWTAVATTDIGVTPFDTRYYNVGTHAAVANTILTGAFLTEWPQWGSFILGAFWSLVAAFILVRQKTLKGVIWGFVIFALLILGVELIYIIFGIYLGVFVPGITVFLTVIGLTLIRFGGTEAEKRYIRSAFSTYLSPDVIKQLEADPDKLKLGGEKKVLTAMFTDVRGFSTISEKMDPNDLVSLLNHYLTQMSDLILDTRGTIDKFEGDAIIAFWGAPLSFEDHALSAVNAALRMKLAETTMNEQLIRDKVAPTPLLTRIGINTGEMTVGNMGTARRMDYTMMGNAVNLAARLEGVNKEYGTWILTTQTTRDLLDDSILVRKLDRVRVVGINTPVRLFEVIAFRAGTSGMILDKITRFEKGIDAYENQDWEGARKAFESVLELDPADGPSLTFLKRTQANKASGMPGDWDGVFSLTSK